MNPTPRTPVWFLLTRSWLSLLGAALVTTAVISLLFVVPQEMQGRAENPYIGIIVFFVLPVVFFSGLVLMAIGTYRSRRQIRLHLNTSTFDRRAGLRRLTWFLGVTTFCNLLAGTQLTYRSVKHMDTSRFCGTTCHSMKPEFAAYQNSPHSRVHCVECHVAPGAKGWIASKASGVRQLIETVFGTEPKPIPSALESNRLVPAPETCENCHWPQQFSGVRLRVFPKFADDEANTRSDTVLLMMIGGDRIPGIHSAHFGAGVHIQFMAADAARQSIPWVKYQKGATREVFTSPDPPAKSPQALPTFEMQCMDCHNRPTHTFELPARAMDKALADGRIPSTLPFIKREGVQLLKVGCQTSDQGCSKLPGALMAFYRQTYPELAAERAGDIDLAAKAILAIYNRNVFLDLKVTWGTYPNNLGHTDFPGCFRCHDGSHATTEGKVITQDCNACHQPLAMEEVAPEILKTLGIEERLKSLERP